MPGRLASCLQGAREVVVTWLAARLSVQEHPAGLVCVGWAAGVAVVSELRSMGHGLERWIVPGLEFTRLGSTLREDNPATYAIVPELLESCRDLSLQRQNVPA